MDRQLRDQGGDVMAGEHEVGLTRREVLVRAGVGTAIALTPISALTYGAKPARAGAQFVGIPYDPPLVRPRGTLLTTWGNFPDGSYVEFSDTTCHGSDRVFTQGNPLVRPQGDYWARYSAQVVTTCYGDSAKVRVHLLGWGNPNASVWMSKGGMFWWCFSVRRSPNAQSSAPNPVLTEVHQQNGAPTCPILQQRPAPFNFQARDSGGKKWWNFIIRGSNDCSGGSFISYAWGKASSFSDPGSNRIYSDWKGGLSAEIVQGEWLHVMCGWNMQPDNTGWFEAWVAKGHGQPMVQVVPRTNAPTTHDDLVNYPMQSLYYDSGATGLAEYEYAFGAISNDFNQLKQWQIQRVGYDLWGGGPGPIVQPPTLRNGSINGTAMTLLFSDALASVTPAGSAFNVKKNGASVGTVAVGTPSGSTVTLTMPAGTENVPTDVWTVAYIQPATNKLQGTNGAAVASFVDSPVANTTPPPDQLRLGKDTIGGSFVGSLVDYKRVSLQSAGVGWTAPADIDISDVFIYRKGLSGNAANVEHSKAVVYLVSGGTATALKGVSEVVTMNGATPAEWVRYRFASPIRILSGQQIAIGEIADASNVTQTAKDTVTGAQLLRLDSYASGPSDPWPASVGGGFTGTYDNQFSAYAVYQLVQPPPSVTSASITGSAMALTFSDAMAPVTPAGSAFTVKKNGASVGTVAVGTPSGSTVTLTMPAGTTNVSSDVWTVAYIQPATNKLQGTNGAAVASFGDTPAVNNTPTPSELHLGKDTIGGSFVGSLVDYKRVSLQSAGVGWTAPGDIDISLVRIYRKGLSGNAANVEHSKAVVYLVSGGTATALKGVSEVVTMNGATAAGWVEYNFASPIRILSGQQIAIGEIADASNVTQTAKDTVTGAQLLRLDSYASGPSDPWSASVGGGFTGTYDNQFSAYAVYQRVQVGATTVIGPTSGPGSSPILDTFDRADEDPIQSPWNGPIDFADSQARLVGNQLAAAAAGSGTSQSFFASQNFGPTTEVWAGISDKGAAGDTVGLWLRTTQPGSDVPSGYVLEVTNGGGVNPDTWTVFKEERGQRAPVGDLPPTSVANEDAIAFGAGGLSTTAPGAVLLRAAVYVQAEKVWKAVGTGLVDSNPLTALRGPGLIGVELQDGSATRIGVFGGGTVDPGPAPVGPRGTPIIDRFDRADEEPIGPPWTGPIRRGNGQNRTILHMLAPSTRGFHPSESVFRGSSFGPGSEVWATILRKGFEGAFLDLWLRVENPNTPDLSGYLLDISYEDGADSWTVYSYVGGVARQLGSLSATEIADFEAVAFVADGSTLIGYHYTRAEGDWIEVGRVTDPTPDPALNGSGFVGIGLASPLSSTRIGAVGGGTIDQTLAMSPAQRRLLGRGGRLT